MRTIQACHVLTALIAMMGLWEPMAQTAYGQAGIAPAATRPNILLVIFDDWHRHAGVYGCTWVKTPNFDRIAKNGALFQHAFTSNPKCSPCRASLLTGRNTWQLKEAVSHNGLFPSGFEVYPDLLERAGYFIGLTGKGWGPGDFRACGRTRNPAGPSFDGLRHEVPATGISRDDYAGNFASFLDERPPGKPFCFWMGFREPHRAYEYGSGERLGKQLNEVAVPPYLPDTELVRRDLADYAVEVEWADRQLGKALDVLESEGALEQTLVVVTSDHGMPFPFVKGQIFEDGYRLPLAMQWPAVIQPGRVVEDFVNVRDLAPTFLELAGAEPHPQMTGKSLTNILRSSESGWIENRDVMLVGKERHDIGRPGDAGYPVRAIRTREYLYVQNFHPDRWPAGNPETDFGNCDPSPSKAVIKRLGGHYYDLAFGKRPAEMLFRLADDPYCLNNLAADPSYYRTARELRERMLGLLIEEQDPRALGQSDVFDSYKYVGGRAKGYETWLARQEETALAELEQQLEAAASQPSGGTRQKARAQQ